MVKDQKQHWDEVYSKNQEFFGEEPSVFAKQALDLFRENGVSELLELGPGQGRDTMFFAENSLEVVGLDYSDQSIAELNAKAQARSLSSKVKIQPDKTYANPFRFLMAASTHATRTCCCACT